MQSLGKDGSLMDGIVPLQGGPRELPSFILLHDDKTRRQQSMNKEGSPSQAPH